MTTTQKWNSKIELSNNSSFVILIFAILKFRNIGRSKFWPPLEYTYMYIHICIQCSISMVYSRYICRCINVERSTSIEAPRDSDVTAPKCAILQGDLAWSSATNYFPHLQFAAIPRFYSTNRSTKRYLLSLASSSPNHRLG